MDCADYMPSLLDRATDGLNAIPDAHRSVKGDQLSIHEPNRMLLFLFFFFMLCVRVSVCSSFTPRREKEAYLVKKKNSRF